MVFDNADVLSPPELEAYLPPGGGGSILITSCNFAMRNLTSSENSLEVNEMEENDAAELLLKASCLDLCSMEFHPEASKIVKELFCLPLAIDQAGAYIASGATNIGTIFQNIQSTEKHYYLIQNLLELLSITKVSMELGNYHTKKSRRGLNLMILTGPLQPTVQCFCSIYFLSSIMRESLRKYFLMLLFKKIKKPLTLNYHLPVLCWIGDYFLSTKQVHGITLSLEREFEYYCHSP